MRFLVVVCLLASVTPARADIPVPNQELCTVEIQERDGSQCESCSWVGYEPGGQEAACGPLTERGLVRRCGYGATAAVAVYCDREANWLEVGNAPSSTSEGSGGCSCDAGSASASFAWILLLTMRRRSPRLG